MAAELARLLTRALPGAIPAHLESYPSASALAQAVSRSGIRLCFLDACTNREAAFRLLSEISTLASDVLVVALLASNDPDSILRCLRQGASEFLVRPFTADQLEAALQKLARSRPASRLRDDGNCRVCCVMPSKGGSGASTLACNLAFHLRQPGSGKLLLADLDPLTGTLAFQLKLKSNFSFLDALARIGNLDADLWKAVVTPCQGLEVLLSPENPLDAVAVPGDPVPLLHYSRQLYGMVVADTGGPFGEWNLALAEQSDDLLLVTTNDLAALHASQRALAYLGAHAVERSKVRLVISRYRPETGMARQEVETALRLEVFHILPGDDECIRRSLLEGKPAAQGSKYAKAVAQLSERLARPETPPKKPLLAELFGGR